MNEPVPVLLDFETQSSCDLRACGSYVYAEHPSTKVLCAFIMLNGHEIFWTMERFNLIMPPGIKYEVGEAFLRDLFSQNVIMIAHNVDFERAIVSRTLKFPDPPGGWADTMDQTLMRGLPAGADAAGQFLLGWGKDLDGYKLMMAYCRPDRLGNMPVITDAVMQRYIEYNRRDCLIQRGIVGLFGYKIAPEWEQRVNTLHRSINHRGVQLDVSFAETLRSFDDVFKGEARREVEEATCGAVKGTDLTRTQWLREWFSQHGLILSDLRQGTIDEVLEADAEGEIDLPASVITVLESRLVVTRSALAKVETSLNNVCADGRMYALLRYWGAHTGRWSGSRVQLQNLRRPLEQLDIAAAIRAVETQDKTAFEACCAGFPPYVLLSSLVRSIIIPKPGCVFVGADFSQIEARVLLWMADDDANLQEHIDYDAGLGPDVYSRMATFLYQRAITKKDKERQVGKIGILSCGYQGGAGAVARFASANKVDLKAAGITAEEIVKAWRDKHPRVVTMWRDAEDAFRAAIRHPGRVFRAAKCAIFGHTDRVEVTLPSGRILTYMNAEIGPGFHDPNREVVAYFTAVKGKVRRVEIYAGKFVQNWDQAIARDLLADAMLRIDETDDIVLSVHDECLAEVPEDDAEAACDSIRAIMCTPPAWGIGIPLKAEPQIMRRYGK